MESMTEAIENLLKREDIEYEPTEFAGVFKIGFAGKNGFFPGCIEANEERRSILVQMLAPARYLRSRRPQVVDLLTRINQRLIIGSFDLGVDGGSIAFRTSVVLGQGDIDHDIIKHLVFANWSTLDRWFPAINAVVFAGVSPKEAISMGRRRRPRSDAPQQEKPDESVQRRLRDILDGSEN